MTYTKKVVCGGESGVGKTTLLTRIVTDRFVDDIKSTIGVDFFVYDVQLADQKATLQLWDFAGQNRFRNVIARYVSGSAAGIIVYDRTNQASASELPAWIQLFREQVKNIPIIIVGSKSDLVNNIVVSTEEIDKMIQPYNVLDHVLISSKTGEGIKNILDSLAKNLISLSKKKTSTRLNQKK